MQAIHVEFTAWIIRQIFPMQISMSPDSSMWIVFFFNTCYDYTYTCGAITASVRDEISILIFFNETLNSIENNSY